jgi:uncharacterized protein (TIGR04255 family)
MNPTPINATNAIDAAAFIIIFDRLFTEQEENRLSILQSVFKEKLPHFSRTTKVTMTHDTNLPEQSKHVVKEAGCKLQRFEPDGKISWSLNVIENQITVTCQLYDRWDAVWEQTKGYIQETLKLLDMPSLKVQGCVLQVVNRFIEDNTSYDIYNVFDKKTAYLTTHAEKAGVLWHVHQGWFAEKSKGQKILNILNHWHRSFSTVAVFFQPEICNTIF